MKFKSLLIQLGATALTVAFVLVSLRNVVAQGEIKKQAERLTGLSVQVEGVRLGNNKITIKRLALLNPKEFKSPMMAEVKDVTMQIDLKSYLLSRRVEIGLLAFQIADLQGERKGTGAVNFHQLKSLEPGAVEFEVTAGQRKASRFLIQRLEIQYGRLVFNEVNLEGLDQKTDFDFQGRKDVLGHVTSPHVLIYAPLVKIMSALERGSLGMPRFQMQKQIMAHTGVIE